MQMILNILTFVGCTRNKLSWWILILITITIATFIFFGSEIHSEIADTPTLYSKVIDLLSIFLILGAFVLPVDVSGRIRLNNLVIGSGAFALLLRLGVGVNRMFVSTGDGVLIGWIVLGFITLGFIFILIKIRNIWRISV